MTLLEFGKGTNAIDGCALMCGVLEHLIKRGKEECPLTLVTTHFSEAFQDNVLSDRDQHIKMWTMSILQGEDEVLVKNGDDIVPLFRLSPGSDDALQSFGLSCARRAGLDAAVIHRAAELTTQLM
eukprot:TRINITY_DN4271_c2_g1_i2.p2 TRINITY_DN4271_c2_g1~~TRINITY_DN4271_c2_g1_i2.p2  ORF type:complete len:125 (+),score=26.86 TRINITY_DN4271_c2_g1_i2:354-728(+)